MSSPSPNRLEPDSRVQGDRLRLERFHAQAVSFLDRAYANEPDTIVSEAPLSPTPTPATLREFHNEAISLLNIAPRDDAAEWRIERDKRRLEQHYQDAMSFLDRGRGDSVVEEQELEPAVVDRMQLQKYAQEAMSFLDKAFRNDASVMVGDEENVTASQTDDEVVQSEWTQQDPRQRTVENEASTEESQSPTEDPSFSDEERRIAADRAALQRYDEEFGDFLSRAYQDDDTVIVEDAESEASGAEQGLFARRMAPSTTSGDTFRSGNDDLSEEVYTDDEFQDVSALKPHQIDSILNAVPRPSTSYDAEAEESFDFATEAETARYQGRGDAEMRDDYGDVAVEMERETPRTRSPASPTEMQQTIHVSFSEETEREPSAEEARTREVEDEDFGADQVVEEETDAEVSYDENNIRSISKTTEKQHGVDMAGFVRNVSISSKNRSSRGSGGSGSWQKQDVYMDVILQDQGGATSEWAEIPLQKSFYRQVPRGSTIKLRPRVSPELSVSSKTGSISTRGSPEVRSLSELRRVEKERDVLMATLEEIVNERSMLAAQVSEMKAMIVTAGGGTGESERNDAGAEEIDLAKELREAHETMAKLTEEMEATLSVLDNRYQETLERAHKAEERCIRMEAGSARMEKEFSKQSLRLSQSLSEESRLNGVIGRQEKEMVRMRKRADSELKRLDEAHRGELDRSVEKILELTNQVSELQERAATHASRSEERGWAARRRLEAQMGGLRREMAEGEDRHEKEIDRLRERQEGENKRLKSEHERERGDLERRIGHLEKEVEKRKELERQVEDMRREKGNEEDLKKEVQRELEETRRELKDEKKGHLAAEAEAAHIRSRYEESLRKRMSRLDPTTEMLELETALTALREEAGRREGRLRVQLAEVRIRAERAEEAANRAEEDAKEAAQMVKDTKEKWSGMLESERRLRRIAEVERANAMVEIKKYEKIANEEESKKGRGLRKSPSKGVGKKKKGGSAEEGKKKSGLRPKLFG